MAFPRRILSIVAATALVTGAFVALTAAPAAASVAEWQDPTFGTSGSTVLPSEGYGYEISNADAQNRIYVATTEFNAGPTRLRRLLANGTVDSTFGGATGVLLPLPRESVPVREIIADPGGTATVFTESAAGVRIDRYTSSGVPDGRFGTNGSLVLPPTEPTFVPWFTDAAPRPSGGYFVAFRNEYDLGDSILHAHHYLSVVTAAGALDPAWAPGAPRPGYLEVPGGFEPTSMAVDGSSLVFAGMDPLPGGGYQSGVVMRLTGAGTLDRTFGDDGMMTAPGYPHRLLVTANAYYGAGYAGVTKLFRDGTPDFSFGDNGLARTVDFGFYTVRGDVRAHLTANHIVLTGHGGGAMGDRVPLIQRFTLDGRLDTGFGDEGLLALPKVTTRGWDLGFPTALQSDGRIVGVGGVGNAIVVRINTTKTPIAPVAGAFIPLAPARILDTRLSVGVGTTTPIPGRSAVQLQVTGAGGVPASGVSAVVLNLTVTEPTAAGFITAYPAGASRPTASNLNFAVGQTIANLVTVQVGAGGQVTLFNAQLRPEETVHILADVAGYYVAGQATQPGTYVPLLPSRLLDTRRALGVGTTTPIPGQGEVQLQVTGAGGVPASGVSAVVLTVTATEPTGAGYIAAYPGGNPRPNVSNLNFAANQTIANLVTVRVGAGGIVTLYNAQPGGSSLHLVADVAGYYRAGDATAPGTFVPLDPRRVLDTRTETGGHLGAVPASGELTLRFDELPGFGFDAVILNVTATQANWGGFITVYPTGKPRPAASNLNYLPNVNIANLVIAKIGTPGTRTLQLRNTAVQGSVHLVADISGYFNS